MLPVFQLLARFSCIRSFSLRFTCDATGAAAAAVAVAASFSFYFSYLRVYMNEMTLTHTNICCFTFLVSKVLTYFKDIHFHSVYIFVASCSPDIFRFLCLSLSVLLHEKHSSVHVFSSSFDM